MVWFAWMVAWRLWRSGAFSWPWAPLRERLFCGTLGAGDSIWQWDESEMIWWVAVVPSQLPTAYVTKRVAQFNMWSAFLAF